MDLVQCRIVTDDVRTVGTFYATLAGVDVIFNDYYMEIPVGAATVGLSKCRFSDYSGCGEPGLQRGELVMDIAVDQIDREFERIRELGVEWVQPPTNQPWGARSMVFRDPEGHPVNMFSRSEVRS